MTTSAHEEIRSRSGYYCVDVDDEPPVSDVREGRQTATLYHLRERAHAKEGNRYLGSTVAEFTTRWKYPDTVAQLLDELVLSGRKREAAAIRRVLGHDDDEAAMRAYVSRLWADDWDSAEDSVYDE